MQSICCPYPLDARRRGRVPGGPLAGCRTSRERMRRDVHRMGGIARRRTRPSDSNITSQNERVSSHMRIILAASVVFGLTLAFAIGTPVPEAAATIQKSDADTQEKKRREGQAIFRYDTFGDE